MMATIPNPPNAPAGYVSKWNGTSWVIVPITANILPAMPENLPEGYTASWDGSEWVITPPPPPPPAPTNREITEKTIYNAGGCLQQVAGLATQALQEHISVASSQAVTQYIHDVGNILATAQVAYTNDEAYSPDFPPMPTLIPDVGGASTFDASNNGPFIQFIVEAA